MSDASPRSLRKDVIISPDAPSGTGPYSPTLVVGDFVYVAGQGPFDPVTDEIRGATIEEQMRLTFKNIAALLAAAGSSLASVIKVNVYLSDMGNYEMFNTIDPLQTPPTDPGHIPALQISAYLRYCVDDGLRPRSNSDHPAGCV
jgi:reactive intermediate/imine deaminase